MHGIGNDFVLLDGIAESFQDLDLAALSKKMCDRRRGVGGDGILLAEQTADGFRMRMWNPDGSESEMCGNGIRCFAKYVLQAGYTDSPVVKVETGAGMLVPEVLPNGLVRVDMGPARIKRGVIGMTGDSEDTFLEQPVKVGGRELPGTSVSMGNPHLVLFVEDAASIPLEQWGPELERHELFPNRVNVHFIQVCSDSHLIQRTWERGAGATLACGTGACASAVAANRTGRAKDDVTISLPGGDLRIECREGENVFMTGPAETVFVGMWPGG
jgi:diaminopimelate epimerase